MMYSITYEDLLSFNGYVNVHASSSDLVPLSHRVTSERAYGDKQSLGLNPVSNPAVSGTATLEKE